MDWPRRVDLDRAEWEIIEEALDEFLNCDRWDEFDLPITMALAGWFKDNK